MDIFKLLESYKTWKSYRYYVAPSGVIYLGFTPSPFSEPYVGKELPYTRCVPWIIYQKRMFRNKLVEDYITCVMAQLMFNNPGAFANYEELETIFRAWCLYWPGNEEVKNVFGLDDIIEIAINRLVKSGNNWQEHIYDIQISKHWYSLDIEMIDDRKKRQSRKMQLLHGHVHSGIRDAIADSSEDYQSINKGVLPTAIHISDDTELSIFIIKKYGGGYFISKRENTEGLIKALAESRPELSQQEIGDILGIDRRTVIRCQKSLLSSCGSSTS